MKYFLLLFVFISALSAQDKSISIEDLTVKHTFYSEGLEKVRVSKLGEYFTVLEDRNKIVKYSFSTGKKLEVVVDLSKLKECPITTISGYEFNNQETRVLVYTDVKPIYRHSFTASYYVVDVQRKEIETLSEHSPQMVPSFSPDGDKVAFVYDNDLHLKKLRFGSESAVTSGGKLGEVLNGIPDWVNEEEFSYNKAYDWSPSSDEIAYVKFDEREVDAYSFSLYKASFPSMDENELYPGAYNYKYPKAGRVNSKVSVHVFNLKHRTTKEMEISSNEEFYIPRIKFTTEPEKLGIVKMNRLQNELELLIANTATGLTNSVFMDRNEKFVESEHLDDILFLDGGKYFMYIGDLDGYNHIHVYSLAGAKVSQVTKGKWDVTKFLGYDPVTKYFYYQAAKKNPLQREVYGTLLDGAKTLQLSTKEGTNEAAFSRDYKYLINTFSNVSTPTTVTLNDIKGKQIRVLKDNAGIGKKSEEVNMPTKEFITIKNSSGDQLNAWLIKPKGFDPNQHYPLLIMQYCGPGSQKVLDEWLIGWEHYLASNGYVVACVDPRGTAARGEAFRKVSYLKLGQLEADDIIDAAKYLGGQSYIDASRIGIWGWSYGGMMTALCMSKSDVFKMGIAVAPITNWRCYDTTYSERYLRKPDQNGKGYDANSPINLVDDLSGRLFIIHSTADDNVHAQHTMEYVDKLVQADKQFDMFIYPNRNHHIYGGNVRKHLYQMKSDYIFRNL